MDWMCKRGRRALIVACERFARDARGAGFLGIELDAARNGTSESVISAEASGVAVRMIRTDDDLMSAKAVDRMLDLPGDGEAQIPRTRP